MFGQFGSTVSQALSTEFFQWFHLEKTGESRQGDLIFTAYQPTSSQFHDLVQVRLGANARQSLQTVQMALRRSFIESPQDYTLATDIAKSFLAAGLPPDDAAMMRTAMAQIRQYQPAASSMTTMRIAPEAQAGESSKDAMLESIKKAIDSGQQVYFTAKSFAVESGKMVPVSAPQEPPPLPGEGEPAYLVYAGKRRQLEQKLPHSLLRMINQDANGIEQVVFSVTLL